VAYRTVHQWARYRLKGKLKVLRRREWKTETRDSRRILKKLSSLIKNTRSSEWELFKAVEKSAILEWRWESDGIAYNTKKKAHRARHKTARKNAMGFYLFVAVGGSRATNRREFFLRVYASGYSMLWEILRAIFGVAELRYE
jgi:hypothetical protein